MSRELYEFLAQKEPDLAAELEDICKEAANIWASQRLEQLTVHGEPHIREVERNLARISDLAPLTARVYTLTRRSATISPPERGGG